MTYDEIRSDTTADGRAVITYRAINSPTGLTLQKTWLDNNNRDKTRPSAVRVQLQRSSGYNPENPTADGVRWEIINSQGSVESGTSDAAYITLQSPTWTYTLEGLPASDAAGSTYYYRLQEVQIQVNNEWVGMTSQNTYEPVYSQPVTLSESAVLTVENGLKTASIKITKQDAQNSSKLLSGAKFTLNRLMQTESGSWIVDTSWSSLEGQTGGPDSPAGNGVLLFENLRPGRYRLTETQAPEGYVASFAPIDITLEADDLGQTIPVTVKNNTPLTFEFTKIAAEDHTKTLAGASFTLYPLVCTDASHTHNDLLDPDNPGPCWGVKRPTVSSDEKGLVQFSNLPAGTYRLVETKAPPAMPCPPDNGRSSWMPAARPSSRASAIPRLPQHRHEQLPAAQPHPHDDAPVGRPGRAPCSCVGRPDDGRRSHTHNRHVAFFPAPAEEIQKKLMITLRKARRTMRRKCKVLPRCF